MAATCSTQAYSRGCIMSTMKAPGIAHRFTPVSTFSNRQINLLSGVSAWIPYEIERGNEAVKLNASQTGN